MSYLSSELCGISLQRGRRARGFRGRRFSRPERSMPLAARGAQGCRGRAPEDVDLVEVLRRGASGEIVRLGAAGQGEEVAL